MSLNYTNNIIITRANFIIFKFTPFLHQQFNVACIYILPIKQ